MQEHQVVFPDPAHLVGEVGPVGRAGVVGLRDVGHHLGQSASGVVLPASSHVTQDRGVSCSIPREILVDEATVWAASGGEFVFRPAGRRMLKGVDQPSEVFSLSIDEAV